MTRFRRDNPDGNNGFGFLQGEVQLSSGLATNALATLQPELVSSLQTDDIAVRRYLAQGMAYYHLQQFPQSKECLDKAEQLAYAKSASLRSEIAVNRGTIFHFRTILLRARSQYRKALRLATVSGDTYLEADSLADLSASRICVKTFRRSN